MFNRSEANYSERLKRKTQQIHSANPKLGWRDAKDRAKAYLQDILNLYPSTPAIMKHYRWLRKLEIGGGLSRMFKAFHEPNPTN